MPVDSQAVLAIVRATRPQLRNDADSIVFVIHSCFLLNDCRLLATGSNAMEEDLNFDESAPEVALDGWNTSDGHYAFVYDMPAKFRARVIVKCLAVGESLMVDTVRVTTGKESEIFHMTITMASFITGEDSQEISKKYKNLSELLEQLDSQIFHPLTTKGFPSHPSKPESSRANEPPDTIERPPTDPLRDYRRSPLVDQSPMPGGIGASDLDPFGAEGLYDPNRAHMRPGLGGGMQLGPGDPYWNRFHGRGRGAPGEGLLGVPPGARYDPIGPPGMRGFEPGRFTREGRRGPDHPDLEHFRYD